MSKHFLNVANLIPPEIDKDIQWVWVGDGPLREELENEAPKNVIIYRIFKW